MDGSIDACQVLYNIFMPSNISLTNNLFYGDSGGPLVWLNGNRFELYGVTSYGRGCALSGFSGMYADITQVKDWITMTIGHD